MMLDIPWGACGGERQIKRRTADGELMQRELAKQYCSSRSQGLDDRSILLCHVIHHHFGMA